MEPSEPTRSVNGQGRFGETETPLGPAPSAPVRREGVDELESSEETLSAQVNEAIRKELVRRRRQRLLGEMLARLDELHGPVDEELVEHYSRLLQ